MDTEGMLRHLAFFEELGKMDESDTSWRAVSAGLVVMRLVDSWIDDGATPSRVDAWGVSAVREAIAEMPTTTPMRRMLSGIVDVLVSSTSVDMHAIIPRLMAYGQALEYDGRSALASDVYRTIVAHSHPMDDGDIVVPASIQLALCLRNLGDLGGAADAYSMASRIATANGDVIGVLRARVGEAKLATARGNMPQAEAILDETIERADQHELRDVHSRALHDRATVAHLRGQHDRAVQFAYRALDFATSSREKDRILVDIATIFLDFGMVDVARDAYLVLLATAQDRYVRWVAGLNLIDVASREGMEPMFDRYRRELENVELPPFLRAAYFLNVGNGYRCFGRLREAVSYLEQAIDVASQNQLNQTLFAAEESLAGAKVAAVRARTPRPAEVSHEVLGVADAIRGMWLKTAGVG
jgi:tetratricopeptide (TPR) repeat protein